MDTKLIQQYGEDILCYRLRTARQKKRIQYEDFDKQLIQLDKYQDELYEQKRNLGWETLHPPVQKGWIRHYVLREDVARSEHADFFENILKKINTFEYSWKKDFKGKRKKRGRKIYIVKPQYLLRPYEYQFFKFNFNEAEKSFFYEVYELDWKKQPVKRFVFKEPWRFILKIKPNMIDKVRVKDAELESKMDEVANHIEKNDLKKRMGKVLHGHYKSKPYKEFEKYNEVNEFKDKSFFQILDKIKGEQR